MSKATTYWGVLCRSCEGLIAFDAFPCSKSGLGAASTKPGTIRCFLGHTHIYFPRDFRLFTSSNLITDATIHEDHVAYEAVNPPSESTSHLDPALWSGVRAVQKAARSESLAPDPRREIAQTAAKVRWADWASKKVL